MFHLSMPAPRAEEITFTISTYQILKLIGKGGMGEVFLAYDPRYGRHMALKRIRPDLIGNSAIYARFIKEARLTSQLTHPNIIPIYAIHDEGELGYYTMPYVRGETLKQVLIRTKRQQQQGKPLDHIGGSISALMRIFLSVCQAVSYAHDKRVLHRDLKPENVILGSFGEVLILDWGLAQLMHSNSSEEEPLLEGNAIPNHASETHLGKIVGTIAYMAPERSLGNPATPQTDIYALGITLYQILTLRMPFVRKTLKEFRQKAFKEKYVDPSQAAPHRDIPPVLTHIVAKCLAIDPQKRYGHVNALIHDLENYLEGRSEWTSVAELDIHKTSDWEFQEHVFFGGHSALTRHAAAPEWVNLMISKSSFTGNTKITAKVRLGEQGCGIGLLLSVPEAAERSQLIDGYCLWLSSQKIRSSKLLRATMEVMSLPELFLPKQSWQEIRLEKVENNIYFYLNDVLQFSFLSHMPLSGTHVGILAGDADFDLRQFRVFVGNVNLTVSCLAIPDAFLAHKEYNCALNEYRRIAYSFPGRAEGREALFRAGITLLEKGRTCPEPSLRTTLFEQSLAEFSKLHRTAGAPLEYLGKAQVYQTMQEFEEESKCFELGLRRYGHHPLSPLLADQLLFRMHSTASVSQRQACFAFTLLAARFIPHLLSKPNATKFLSHLMQQWEVLPFMQVQHAGLFQPSILSLQPSELAGYELHSIATALAFWLGKMGILEEMITQWLANISQQPAPAEIYLQVIADAYYSALYLGFSDMAIHETALPQLAFWPYSFYLDVATQFSLRGLAALAPSAIALIQRPLPQSDELACFHCWRCASFLIDKALDAKQNLVVEQLCHYLEERFSHKAAQKQIGIWRLWSYLQQGQWDHASLVLQQFSIEELCQDDSLLHFLYGCYLEVSEGHEIALAHFSCVLDMPYPPSCMLFNYYITGKLKKQRSWISQVFLFEKRQLWRQLALYYECLADVGQVKQWQEELQKSYAPN